LADLLGLIRRLRGEGGCPWDREQTLRTMTPYLLEEAYEVIDAIERGDSAALREELGDLIFLLFFCAEVGREEARFTIVELLEGHLRKMIGRHPHVFGPAGRLAPGEAAKQWEELKQEEGAGWRSVVDGRVKTMPALTAAYRIQEKAAAVGFDWENVSGVLDKIEEEIAELRAELEANPSGAGRKPASDAQHHELGDLLFALVNLARALQIDPEGALRATTARFIRRFRYIEEQLARAGTRPSQAGLAEMDRLWNEAKAQESKGADETPPGQQVK
jgi:MazG family protein